MSRTYRDTLAAISAKTKTPLPSLILSFGILHELTAVVPLVGFFYAARALGVGERVVNFATQEDSNWPWVRSNLKTWVDEGEQWAGRIGRRYGVFGFEKRRKEDVDSDEELHSLAGNRHLTGDIANAVVAYGATKVRGTTL